MKKILIVGAGFSGAVIAERLSQINKFQIDIIEERNHIAGNCHTEKDKATNIMVHQYGPHIFNTDNQLVWDYVTQFCEMMPFINRVKAEYNNQIYSLPINLHTINQFFGKSFNPKEAKDFITQIADDSIIEPENFEQQALKFIGKDLYEAFFYGYTKKQWGTEPSALPASILKRIPVRFNYNDNYYNNPLQGIPKEGYTEIVRKMLDHPSINIKLGVRFDNQFDTSKYDHIFYTGPIDALFNFKYGRLGYRTVYFEKHVAEGDYQGNAVINYSNSDTPFTRIHEHKHFTPWEEHKKTIYFKEFSKETKDNDVPYYPKRLASDLEIYQKYKAEAKNLSNYTFLGRLATYRYMDMHHVIGEALDVAKSFLIQQ
jgi:UDP-galactopyranose mutase